MTTFPNSPRLLKGGIVLLDPTTSRVLRIISLQYNPDTLTRSFQVKGVGAEGGDRSEALRLKGPPVETLKLEAEVDATDALEVNNRQAAQLGLHPLLAVIESLIYPTSDQLIANNRLAAAGTLEITPMQTPLTLFLFGPNRLLPVRVTELSITEEAFDVALNPIRAKISLGMRVLSVDDIGFTHKGGTLFMRHLLQKEQFASMSPSSTFRTLGIGGIP